MELSDGVRMLLEDANEASEASAKAPLAVEVVRLELRALRLTLEACLFASMERDGPF